MNITGIMAEFKSSTLLTAAPHTEFITAYREYPRTK